MTVIEQQIPAMGTMLRKQSRGKKVKRRWVHRRALLRSDRNASKGLLRNPATDHHAHYFQDLNRGTVLDCDLIFSKTVVVETRTR